MKVFRLWLFLLPFFFFCGCKFHPEIADAGHSAEPCNETVNPWTVILYFSVDNVQFGAFPTDLWGLTDNLLAGGAALARPDFPVIMLYDGGDKGDSVIIDLAQRRVIDDRGRVIDPAEGEVNYGDPGTMSRFIVWAAEKYPARHYLLGLCHHYGWKGYNTDESSPGPIGMDILNMPEHAAAMKSVREAGVAVDVIWFEACSITMLETLYQYAMDAELIVGNQDTIDFFEEFTRPFRVLASMGKNPDMSPGELAAELVSKTPVLTPSLVTNQFTPYSFALNPKSPGGKADVKRLFDLWLPTQYAFSSGGITEVAAALDELAGLLIASLDEERENIISARKKAREYTLSPWYVDLWDFCDLLEKTSSNAGITSACGRLRQKIDNSIVAEKKLFLDKRHHGILIQFPLSGEEYERQTENEFDTGNSYSDLAFAKDTRWDEFMKALWQGQD